MIFFQIQSFMTMNLNDAICCWNFLKTGESLIATQWAFHVHFMLYQNDAVLDRKSILLLVQNFNPEQDHSNVT